MSDQQQDAYRGLGWKFGSLTVQRHAAMLAPITFLLPDGRQVSPMQVAPWAEEPDMDDQPGILRRLRGEWPCVPFGYAVDDPTSPPEWKALMGPAAPADEIHGHSSNHPWTWQESDGRSLKLSIEYPEGNPVRRLVRTITPDPDAPGIDIELTIEVREAHRSPLGLHPCFRLPLEAFRARIEPARFDNGRTYPGTVEPTAPLFAIDKVFSSLTAVPGRDGSTIDASRFPLAEATEDLLQLNGIDGSVALVNEAEGYRVRLRWQKEHFPSLLLWITNRGRWQKPWNGRHVALGMEPICSPFGLGPATATADNPIARSGTPTARAFAAGEIFSTRYCIEAEAI